jgi:hypothetical protein
MCFPQSAIDYFASTALRYAYTDQTNNRLLNLAKPSAEPQQSAATLNTTVVAHMSTGNEPTQQT